MIEILTIPFHSALIGVAWVFFLTGKADLFGWWPVVAERISSSPTWLKFAYGCEKCIAGQIALWWTFFVKWSIVNSFFAALYAIFLAWLIGRIVDKINNL